MSDSETNKKPPVQLNLLLPVDGGRVRPADAGQGVTKESHQRVAYRSKEFYEIRDKLIRSLA